MKIVNSEDYSKKMYKEISDLLQELEMCTNKLSNIKNISCDSKLEFASTVLENATLDVEDNLFITFKEELNEFVEIIKVNTNILVDSDQELSNKLGGAR